MTYFHYQNSDLTVEQIKLADLANQFGTPLYVYSRAALENNWQRFNNAFSTISHRICYAVKANSNLAILNLFAKLNSGFDIVSVGELERLLVIGADPNKIVFSGVGKKKSEIKRALEVGIHCFNVESSMELERIHSIATELKIVAPIALRINPDIDPGTHPYISTGLKENKFGIDKSNVKLLINKIQQMPFIKLIGIAAHIGSQLTELAPFLTTIDILLELQDELKHQGIMLEHINIGGGLGIHYHQEDPPSVEKYANAICERFKNLSSEIILEPGRILVANTSVLLTQVEYIKTTPHKNFAIVDAGMNDLIRPALYHAWQNILPCKKTSDAPKLFDVVGPVCESADFLGKDRLLALQQNDLLAIHTAGAYGFSMSSNYNSRPRAAEVLVDKDKVHLIHRRETFDDLFKHDIF